MSARTQGCLLVAALLLSGVSQASLGLSPDILQHAYIVPLFGLAAIAVAEHVVLRRAIRRVQVFDWLMLIWIAFAALTAAYSEAPDLTLRRVVPLVVLYASVMWSIWSYTDAVGEERVVDTLLLAVPALGIISLLLLPLWPNEMLADGRLRGIVGVPNWLGLASAVVFPLSLWRAMTRRRTRDYAVAAVLVIVVILTGSRGSVAAVAVGAVYILWKSRSPLRWVPALGLAGLALLLGNAESLRGTWLDVGYLRLDTVANGSGRFQPWMTMIDIVGQRPAFGYGFGTEQLVLGEHGVLPYELSGLHIHDSFLGLAAQTGVIGMLAFFGPLFVLVAREIRSEWFDTSATLRTALLACVLAGLAECVTESWIYSTGNPGTFPFWLVLMLLLRASVSPRSS